MIKAIKVVSALIILLGIVHVGFAFPFTLHIETVWFVGSGMAIVFAGIINFVALDRGGSRTTKAIAAFTNGLGCLLFNYAFIFINEIPIYIGILLFLFNTVALIIEWKKTTIKEKNSL